MGSERIELPTPYNRKSVKKNCASNFLGLSDIWVGANGSERRLTECREL